MLSLCLVLRALEKELHDPSSQQTPKPTRGRQNENRGCWQSPKEVCKRIMDASHKEMRLPQVWPSLSVAQDIDMSLKASFTSFQKCGCPGCP